MPTPADSPLRKVTLNLYEADCIILERYLGHGWTTTVREWVNSKASYYNRGMPKPILGDLANDC